jgi:deazaflavin-dependent oxidoreductase (nitroreductase family)
MTNRRRLQLPRDLTLKAMNAAHRAWIALTRGHGGWDVGRMPVLELTTTGRRTGRPHSVLLTSPVQVGETFVVVASRGGDDSPPAWLLNLRAEPRVRVRLHGGPPRQARARVAIPDERQALWPRVTSAYRGYARYQARTNREIALVLIEPASDATDAERASD